MLMKTVKSKSLLYAIGCALFVGSTVAHATGAKPNTFSGRAFVVQVKLLGGINITLVDTGPLPSTGGSLSKSLADLDLLGITAKLLSATTSGGGKLATSSAELADLNISLPLLGGLLDASALVVQADSKAECVNRKPKVSGSSVVADLVVLGKPITVTGEPNQTIDVLGLAKVVINEQKASVVGQKGDITVNAVHITVADLPALPPLADIIVSSAHSDITCAK